MGLFEMINNKVGYTEEQMLQVFRSLFPAGGEVQIRYPIAVSFKMKTSLFQSRAYASGFAAITTTNALVTYHAVPVKIRAMYDLASAKKLQVKDSLGGQKVLEAKVLNVVSMEFDDLTLQISSNVPGFPNQMSNAENFIMFINGIHALAT